MRTTQTMPALSCLPVSLYTDFETGRMDADQWAAAARGLGLDAMDINVPILRRLRHPPPFPVDTVAAYTDFTHPDESVRENEFRLFQEDIHRCAEIGALYLRVTAGQAHPDTPVEHGLDWAEFFLKHAAAVAARHGVGLLFENHSRPGAWRHDDFAAEPVVYFALMRRLEEAGIDLLFDTANACYYRQDPVRMLAEIYPRVRRIHVADILLSETLSPVRIGRGIVPLQRIFSVLKERRYAGGLSVEEASFEGLDGVEKAVRETRTLWNTAPAKTGDPT